jgi:hypothetical protein
MSTFKDDLERARAVGVFLTVDELRVTLIDGRTLTVPLLWFPRLVHGTASERKNWRFIGKGEGIHWPELDEDISIANLLAGKPSMESQSSFKKWLEGRTFRKARKPKKH